MKKVEEMNKTEIKVEIDRTGKNIQVMLDRHFAQWQAGLPFKVALSPYSAKSKHLGFSGVSDLAQKLQDTGYIKLFSSPSGRRFVFSSKCEWTDEETLAWLQDQEMIRETEKEHKKLQKQA